MINFINTWQFNLVGYLICVVLFFQFYKIALRHSKNDGAATILLQAIGGISILVLVPFLEIKFPQQISTYIFLALACIFYAINDRLQTTARKHIEVSVFSIINQLSNVFLILIGITVFKESTTILKLVGAGLILLGNISLFYERGKINLNKYVWISIIATLSFAIAISIDIDISKQFNLPIYIMLTLVTPALMIMSIERIAPGKVVDEFKSDGKKYYFVTGFVWGLVVFFALRAFQFGRVTTIVPLQSTSVLLNVVIAYLFLKEKDNLPRKVIAATLVISGICLTVLT